MVYVFYKSCTNDLFFTNSAHIQSLAYITCVPHGGILVLWSFSIPLHNPHPKKHPKIPYPNTTQIPYPSTTQIPILLDAYLYKRKKKTQDKTNNHFSFKAFVRTSINIISTLFFDLSKPGMISTNLGHIGSSTHPRNGQLGLFREQDQNLLFGLGFVQDVTLTTMLPYIQITIFSSSNSSAFA